jgi:TolA-binding protein
MKKLMLALAICLFTIPAFAQEVFTPITKDNEVTSVDAVQVKKEVVTQKTTEETLTLRKIDADIAKIQARISHLNGDIADLQALRAKVLKLAEKVVLKPIEEPKPIE